MPVQILSVMLLIVSGVNRDFEITFFLMSSVKIVFIGGVGCFNERGVSAGRQASANQMGNNSVAQLSKNNWIHAPHFLSAFLIRHRLWRLCQMN